MVSTDRPVRVLVADDDAFVRSALTTMLSANDGTSVVATAGDGAQVIAAVDRYHPDIVLMDIRMPGMDGLAATERLCVRAAAPRIIILTTFDADEYVMRALRAGAAGFLLKDCAPDELFRAIETVAGGDAMLSPAVTRRLLAQISDPARAERRSRAREALARLSDRERDVAYAVGRGRSNAEISAELFLSTATVKTHVSSVLSKLGVGNRVEVALIVHDSEPA
ncbi:LuxR family two component transcriptional regulator [Actinoallomurus bryophytorum]|uniref:LuxR family two component transcriptional regulator n=1 Tax=Actinoallomurus bryophytorum TaxID=1490222 RepID=A0A543BZG1_9ACTN|nr:response regulator transcription factor [Actinoallomurus bryophytorum]TQL90166.1 LuxR family two component transcriptional regulator [Actinoallomurus bryophytorum]